MILVEPWKFGVLIRYNIGIASVKGNIAKKYSR